MIPMAATPNFVWAAHLRRPQFLSSLRRMPRDRLSRTARGDDRRPGLAAYPIARPGTMSSPAGAF